MSSRCSDELGFAQRRIKELNRRLVEQDAAVLQLNTSNEQLQARADELLAAKQHLELALATTRFSVIVQKAGCGQHAGAADRIGGKARFNCCEGCRDGGSEVEKNLYLTGT